MIRRLAICLMGLIISLSAAMADDGRDVFELLDLNRPGLEKVRKNYEKGRLKKASKALLKYYRHRKDIYIPGQDSRKASGKDYIWASDAMHHRFHVLEDTVWNYGKDINWEYWPVKDIEMRVQLHRQGWWTSLGKVYCTTGKKKFAREYVAEFRDWVAKNPYKPFGISGNGTVSSGTNVSLSNYTSSSGGGRP